MHENYLRYIFKGLFRWYSSSLRPSFIRDRRQHYFSTSYRLYYCQWNFTHQFGATVREFYEIENHKQAFERITSHLINDESLSVTIIKEIHADLTDRLQYDKGQFKKSENMIIGAEFQSASPAETPLLVAQLVDNLQYRLDNAKTNDDKLLAILDTHIQFERIHPFSDGNGRTGRMIMMYSLLQEGFPPLIIEKETKAQYVDFWPIKI